MSLVATPCFFNAAISAAARSLLRWSAAWADGSVVCTPMVTVITSGVPST